MRGNGCCLRLRSIASERGKPIGNIAVLAHRPLRNYRIAACHEVGLLVHTDDEAPQSASVENTGTGEHLGVTRAWILREVADLAGAVDLSRGRQHFARERLRERRFSRTGAPDKPNFISRRNPKRDVCHEYTGSDPDFEVMHGEHGASFRVWSGVMVSGPLPGPASFPPPLRRCAGKAPV